MDDSANNLTVFHGIMPTLYQESEDATPFQHPAIIPLASRQKEIPFFGDFGAFSHFGIFPLRPSSQNEYFPSLKLFDPELDNKRIFLPLVFPLTTLQ